MNICGHGDKRTRPWEQIICEIGQDCSQLIVIQIVCGDRDCTCVGHFITVGNIGIGVDGKRIGQRTFRRVCAHGFFKRQKGLCDHGQFDRSFDKRFSRIIGRQAQVAGVNAVGKSCGVERHRDDLAFIGRNGSCKRIDVQPGNLGGGTIACDAN